MDTENHVVRHIYSLPPAVSGQDVSADAENPPSLLKPLLEHLQPHIVAFTLGVG